MLSAFWLQIVLFAMFAHLIRPQIVGLCLFRNAWGVAVYLFHARRTYLLPYTYES